MDKYEYKACADEIRNLISEGKYSEAVDIADTIDWRRVKSISMLCYISDLYKVNRRYQESKEILLLAYERHPENPRIIYSLCELSIKIGEFVQALDYYNQYVHVAPKSSRRYILKYKMYVAQEVNLGERIELLEELKKQDYLPKWAYELAFLYHSTGQEAKCVSECDEIFAFFGDGRYVRKALELKEMHAPLSEMQSSRLNAWRGGQEEEIRTDTVSATATEEEAPEDEDDVEITKVLPSISSLLNADRPLTEEEKAYVRAVENADTVPLPSNALAGSIEVKTMDVSRYNTQNLQQALAESMRQFLTDKEEMEIQSKEDLTGYDENAEDYGSGEVPEEEGQGYGSDAGYGERPENGAGYEGYEGEAAQETGYTEEGYYENGTGEGAVPYAEAGYGEGYGPEGEAEPGYGEGYGPESEAEPGYGEGYGPEGGAEAGYGEGSGYDPAYGQQAGYGEEAGAEPGPQEEQYRRVPPEEIARLNEERAIAREEAEEATDEAYERARETLHLIKRDTDELRKMAALNADKLAGARTGTLTPLNAGATRIDGMLLQNEDGQIAINVPDREELDRQITGQMDIGDVLDEWERVKKENERKRRDEIKKKILQNTGNIFDEFDEETRNGLLEQLQQAFVNSMTREEAEGKKEYKPVSRRVAEREENARIKAAAEKAAREQKRRLAEPEMPEEEPEISVDDVQAPDAESHGYDESQEYPEEQGYDREQGYRDEQGYREEQEYPEEQNYRDEQGYPDEEPAANDSGVSGAEEQDEDTADEAVVRKVSEAIDYVDDQRQPAPVEKVAESRETPEKEGKPKRVLTDEEKELFGRFIKGKKERSQIIFALDHMSMAAYAGNVVLIGSKEAGTLELAKNLIREMKTQDSNFTGRVAKVNGHTIIQRDDLPRMIDQIRGGALVIEDAAAMGDDKAAELCSLLENNHNGALVIIADRKDRIRNLFSHTPALKNIFDIRIVVKSLDDDALVEYARKYAESKDCTIDEFGFLALHERIAEMQTADHEVTTAEIREVVDDAIYWAEKKTLGHLWSAVVGKRYDKNDMVILREKDFQHY